jgi:hypothetical protein
MEEMDSGSPNAELVRGNHQLRGWSGNRQIYCLTFITWPEAYELIGKTSKITTDRGESIVLYNKFSFCIKNFVK